MLNFIRLLSPYLMLLSCIVCAWSSATATCEAVALSRIRPGRHPVSVVEAEIYVDRFRTTMKLTCFAEDLELLQGVEALEDGLYDSEELKDAVQDHAQYLAEKVVIRDARGEIIPAIVTDVIDFEIPESGIKSGQLMSYVMAFVLEYEYQSPPEFLTIKQDMVADGALLPSELKILLKQAGSETPYRHMMKPDSPETFRFDWEQPLLAPDAPAEDWESWFADQQTKTLGIDSYSSTYSFIYIGDHQVRHEVLIPLATLATLMEFGRADESFLEVEEQKLARRKIEAWFGAGNPVKIDGVEAPPVFDRIDFYGLDLRDFAVQADARKVSMASGRVGVIMAYTTEKPPQQVDVTWDLFNHAIKSVDSVIFAYDKTRTTAFSKFLENNTFSWTAPTVRKLVQPTPVITHVDPKFLQPARWSLSLATMCLLSLAGLIVLVKPLLKYSWTRTVTAAAVASATAIVIGLTTPAPGVMSIPVPFARPPAFTINETEARQVFERIHQNLFKAFDFREQSAIYDALAVSVDGPLLRKLYLDINQSLKIREQGGAVARIDDVEVLSSSPGTRRQHDPASNPRPGFGWHCQWNLAGTVEHWGHVHQRINQYDAEFDVTLCDGSWKITDMQMTDIQGLLKTSLRKLDPAP